MAKLLQKGDIIRLEKGMMVFASMPENIYYGCAKYPDTPIHVATKIGKTYRISPVSENEVIKSVYHFVRKFNQITYLEENKLYHYVQSFGAKPSKELKDIVESNLARFGSNPTWGDITNLVKSLNIDYSAKSYDTSKYEGEYVVDNVFNSSNNSYLCRNRWHVSCYKLDDPSIKVDFYQTGESHALNHANIEAIGHV